MGAYPTSPRAAFLEWCQAHTSVFTANATQIGLTAGQATAFSTATTAAAAAMAALLAAAGLVPQIAPHRCWSSRAASFDLPTSPTCCACGAPSLNRISVGMPRTP